MAKNIVLCLDGTGNQLKATANTNVVRLFQMLDLEDPSQQVAFYDPGVGTSPAPHARSWVSRKWTKLLGLALGHGIKQNVADAYTFLMANYVPGDQVFLFGFSRGSYTARGVAGITYRAGLMRPGQEHLVKELVGAYAKGDSWSDDDWDRIDEFAKTFSVRHGRSLALPIHFVGLWDSVKALGVLRWDPKWPYTRQLPNARTIRHAVSINENRRPYAEYLAEPKKPDRLSESWFAGVHSDVGGAFADDMRLGRITLKWMLDGALEAGLLLRPGAYARECTVTRDDATGQIHRMGRVWAVLTYRTRPIPAGARVHASVSDRGIEDPGLTVEINQSDVVTDDVDWTVASPRAT